MQSKTLYTEFPHLKSWDLAKTLPSGQIKGAKWLEGIFGMSICKKRKTTLWLDLFWERNVHRFEAAVSWREHCVTTTWAVVKETSYSSALQINQTKKMHTAGVSFVPIKQNQLQNSSVYWRE